MVIYMPIISIPMLRKLKLETDFRNAFILGSLLDNERYADFWREFSWDKVIIDNGEYEGNQTSILDINRYAQDLDAKEVFIVLPDVRFNPRKTFELYLRWRGSTDFNEAYVVHSPDGLFRVDDIEMVCFPQEVRQVNPNIHLYYQDHRRHAFGFFSFEDPLNHYESFDTTYPFTRAFRGVSLEVKEVPRLPLRTAKFNTQLMLSYLNMFLEKLRKGGVEVCLK